MRVPLAVLRQRPTVVQRKVRLPAAERLAVQQRLPDLSNPLTLPLQALQQEPTAPAQPPLS